MPSIETITHEAERAAFKAEIGLREHARRGHATCVCTPGSPCDYHAATVAFALPVRR